MATLDELTSKIIEGGMKAANSAKEAAGLAKMTVDIKAEELKMLDVYKEIGKLFCEKAEGEVDPEFIPLLKKIEDSKAKIAQIKEEKERMKASAPETEDAEVVDEEAAQAEEAVEADATVTEEEVAATVDAAVEEVAEAAEEVAEEAKALVEEAVDQVAEAAEEVKETIFAE